MYFKCLKKGIDKSEKVMHNDPKGFLLNCYLGRDWCPTLGGLSPHRLYVSPPHKQSSIFPKLVNGKLVFFLKKVGMVFAKLYIQECG